MSNDLEDIPVPGPLSNVTTDQVIHGPRIPPQQQIMLYSGEEWEGFIHEWVHYCLKEDYTKVVRIKGGRDRGIDIAGFTDAEKLQGVWDMFQCKHYDHALRSDEAWPEIGKVLWYSFRKEYNPPRRYFFVAPLGVGTGLASYLADTPKLKNAVIDKWQTYRKKITDKEEILLEGRFLAYVEAFDFSIFDAKPTLEILEAHRRSPYHAARFGGGLPPRPEPAKPPCEIAPAESRYVGQLLEAYADYKKEAVPDINSLKAWQPLKDHFMRQREAFYHAESLRVFARDSVPEGTFESLQDDIYSHVIDVHDAEHPDGYTRVCKVTQAAREVQITSNPLITCARPKDRDGICHQLANEDRLRWTKK